METKPTIAIDIDDVIADSTDALRVLVNERTGATLTCQQYIDVGGEYWGYYERVWQSHGLTEVSYRDIETELIADQSRVPLLAGAEFAIHRLAERFHIIFITARPKAWEQQTRRWFALHFGGEDIELYFCESYIDSKAKTKGQLCKDLGAQWLIDDNVSHCRSAIDQGIRAVRFGQYGWQTDIPAELIRCNDWPAVLEVIDPHGA